MKTQKKQSFCVVNYCILKLKRLIFENISGNFLAPKIFRNLFRKITPGKCNIATFIMKNIY